MAETRAPFVLPRSSSQFSFVPEQELGVPCILTLSAGERKADTRFRTGARNVTVALPPADRVTGSGPVLLTDDRLLGDVFCNPSPTEFHLEDPTQALLNPLSRPITQNTTLVNGE